jgi:hypothetical protein
MHRDYVDEEWNRDARFASRNLVSLEFTAEHLKVTRHAVGSSTCHGMAR